MSLGAAKAALLGAAGSSGGAVTLYRYLRVTSDIGYNSNGLSVIKYKQADTAEHPQPYMTTNVLPSPLVASESLGGSLAYRPYDNTSNVLAWPSYTNGQWSQIDLGAEAFDPAGGHALVTAVLYTGGGSLNLRKIEASNTGAFTGEQLELWTGTQALAHYIETQINFTV